MAPSLLKSAQSVASPTAQNAIRDDRAFAAWSEAVKQQMLAALQKRQKDDQG